MESGRPVRKHNTNPGKEFLWWLGFRGGDR
jgi:hypothetical protein